MAILGAGDYLCEVCKHFDTDGIDGNHPECARQPAYLSYQMAVRLGDVCPYGYEYGVPSAYPCNMEHNRERAKEIMAKIGREVIS